MSQIKKAAAKFAQKQLREYPMGTLENPDLDNIVKNIQSLIEAFNYYSYQVGQLNTQTEENSQVLQQLENSGAEITDSQ